MLFRNLKTVNLFSLPGRSIVDPCLPGRVVVVLVEVFGEGGGRLGGG